jgi:hypothetical protein
MTQISLRPHDVCVALQLVLTPRFSYRELAKDVGLSLGAVHSSAKRLEQARLFLPEAGKVNVSALVNLLVHGVPYVFPGQLGPETQGVATARSGPALARHLPGSDAIVWPSAEGDVRGQALVPLCASAPELVQKNEALYRWLTLADALRVGEDRERRLAEEILRSELAQWASEISPRSASRPRADRGRRPTLVAHADWGTAASERWMCVAELWEDGTYWVSPPEVVGDATTLLARLVRRSGGGPVLVGFDFPIGVPSAYAELAGIQSFPEVLAEFGKGRWSRFFDVAGSPDEIEPTRPFYPMRPGGTRHVHLTGALGVDSMDQLMRSCERSHGQRGAASSLFWTLGGKQVGKAAISGWRDVLGPALRNPDLDVALWPFDGSLDELMAARAVVVVETYPAEACVHLGLEPPGRGWSKRSQEGRRRQADRLEEWTKQRPVEFDDPLEDQVREGFGEEDDGEDPFDALLGLLSMLEVVMGYRTEGTPEGEPFRTVEGWILGQGGSEKESDAS